MLHLEERLRMGDEIMKTYIYEGGFGIVAKSGVGSAIKHQKNMLKQADIEEAKSWKEADIVHINTVFPDSVLAACLAKMQGKKVVYYGHSTMEDFRNSFIGSNRFVPLFKKWICFCYGLGDIVITPTEYSKGLLKSYGIQKKIYAVSNGVDTEFFQSRNKEKEKQELHEKYKIPMNRKVVVSAGHLIQRKGILDFLKLAKMMPETTFIWFGGGNDSLVTQEVKEAVKKKSENVIFIQQLLTEYPEKYVVSVSATTRKPRKGEVDGKSYYFKKREEFEDLINKNEFLEFAEYAGEYYGTLKKDVYKNYFKGKNVIIEIDSQGARQIREKQNIQSVFLIPPSFEELLHRLKNRGTESKESIHRRLKQALDEIEHIEEYGVLLVNDSVEGTAFMIDALFHPSLKNVSGMNERELKIAREIQEEIIKYLSDEEGE